MKRVNLNLLTAMLVILFVTSFSSCKKDSSTEPETEKITFTVDGTQYETSNIQGADAGFGLMIVGSLTSEQRALSILFDYDGISTGTYTFGDANYSINWDVFITTTEIDRYTARSGSITIDEYNAETGKIKGTFNAVCKTLNDSRTVTITNGSFIVYE